MRSRNHRGEGVRLRADILVAATGLLDWGGERAVTLRAVAREVGIATPSIYPHFPDRSAVLLAVVRAASAELTHRIRVAMTTASPDDRLYAAGHAYFDFAAAHPRRYRATFELADPDPVIVRLLAGALSECVAAGYSASTDPAADAVALWLGLHGVAHQRSVIHNFPWSADLVPHVVASLAHLDVERSHHARHHPRHVRSRLG
ncbi:TetR/AcrR family transcriptional regulator [Actinophytocola sp.]|uniref:TetR/AcrR family transcriptional regulator n=1 Tax=Actinophytocola sp. TaxID=1872138 RepID=UPI002ED0C662